MTASFAVALLLATSPAAPPSAASPAAAPGSALLEALHAESARALSSLRTEGFDKPYYVSAAVVERRAASIEAAGPALLPARQSRQRWLRVTVRVGGYELDNSGFVDQMGGSGAGEVVVSFPLDDDPVAMRRSMWLAFDEAYKEAGATLAAKTAYLTTQGGTPRESFGDFTREEPRRERAPIPTIEAERPRLEPLLRRLAAVLGADQETSSRLRIALVERRMTFVDSEGSELEGGNTFAALESAAWSSADDGMPVRDLVMRYAPTLAGLGKPEELEGALKTMLASVAAQRRAPKLDETYHGPVLFEDESAAQVISTFLAPRLSEPREPLSASGGGARGAAGEWGSRLGSRVLAPLLTVVDDPTLAERGGRPLIGGYRFDFDGVFGQPVKVIVNGVLKDFVGTRWPRKGALKSNGHARRSGGAPWNLGSSSLVSNLIVSAGEGAVSADAARRRFLEEIGIRSLPFGIVIRRLDDSSILELGATDWLEVGDFQGRVHENSELEMPVSVWRVAPDGSEQRLRGVRFGQVRPEVLRTPLAITGPAEGETVYNMLLTFDLGYTLTGPVSSTYLPLSIVAPRRLVLEEVELQAIPGPFVKRPLAAARAAAPRR